MSKVRIIPLILLLTTIVIVSFSGWNTNDIREQMNVFYNTVMIVHATSQSGAVWKLNMSKVAFIQKYSDPSQVMDVDSIYNALAEYADSGQLMAVEDGVIGNKTIALWSLEHGKVSKKFGFYVKSDGTVYVWAWRSYGDDRDLALTLYWSKDTVKLSTTYIMTQILSTLNNKLGTSFTTNYNDIIQSSTYYVPLRPDSSAFGIYYGVVHAYNGETVKKNFYALVPSSNYSDAVYVFVGIAYYGSVTFYVNGTQITKVSGTQTSVGYKTYMQSIVLDTPYSFGITASALSAWPNTFGSTGGLIGVFVFK